MIQCARGRRTKGWANRSIRRLKREVQLEITVLTGCILPLFWPGSKTALLWHLACVERFDIKNGMQRRRLAALVAQFWSDLLHRRFGLSPKTMELDDTPLPRDGTQKETVSSRKTRGQTATTLLTVSFSIHLFNPQRLSEHREGDATLTGLGTERRTCVTR